MWQFSTYDYLRRGKNQHLFLIRILKILKQCHSLHNLPELSIELLLDNERWEYCGRIYWKWNYNCKCFESFKLFKLREQKQRPKYFITKSKAARIQSPTSMAVCTSMKFPSNLILLPKISIINTLNSCNKWLQNISPKLSFNNAIKHLDVTQWRRRQF